MARISLGDDIDPKTEDVGSKPKRRRRRPRVQPEPSAALKAEGVKALARMKKRPSSPGVMWEYEGQEDGGRYLITSPHADLDLWELQIADAFGTRSWSVVRTFTTDLKRLCSQSWDEPNHAWKPNEREMNAALAMVADMKPDNVAQAALAAQMVAVHLMTMRLSQYALNRGGMIMEREAALAGKLARTFVQQIEAMQGLKGKRRSTRQTITVKKELHQSVHYHDHRGSEENERQPHDTTATATGECPALPSNEPRGQVVRLPSRKGKTGV